MFGPKWCHTQGSSYAGVQSIRGKQEAVSLAVARALSHQSSQQRQLGEHHRSQQLADELIRLAS